MLFLIAMTGCGSRSRPNLAVRIEPQRSEPTRLGLPSSADKRPAMETPAAHVDEIGERPSIDQVTSHDEAARQARFAPPEPPHTVGTAPALPSPPLTAASGRHPTDGRMPSTPDVPQPLDTVGIAPPVGMAMPR